MAAAKAHKSSVRGEASWIGGTSAGFPEKEERGRRPRRRNRNTVRVVSAEVPFRPT